MDGGGRRICERASAAFFCMVWLRGGAVVGVVRGVDEFCGGSADAAGHDVAELRGCVRRLFVSAGDPEHGDGGIGDGGGGVVFQCAISLVVAPDRCAVPGVVDHVDRGGGDRTGVFEGDGVGDVAQSEDRADQQVFDVPVWDEPGAVGD